MTRAIALTVLAAAASAPAQTTRINIDIDAAGAVFPGDSVTVILSAAFDPGDYAVAGVQTDLLASAPVDLGDAWSDLQLIAPMDGPGTTAGVGSGASVTGVIAGQLNFPIAGIYADSTNPIAFWQATFTAPASVPGPYFVDLSTSTSRFDVYPERGAARSESRLDVLAEGVGGFPVIPAPGSMAVLGLGLVAAARRRR